MAPPVEEPKVLHLYRTDLWPDYWIASTISQTWYRFPDKLNGWAERSPFADFQHRLEEVTDQGQVREITKRCGIAHLHRSR